MPCPPKPKDVVDLIEAAKGNIAVVATFTLAMAVKVSQHSFDGVNGQDIRRCIGWYQSCHRGELLQSFDFQGTIALVKVVEGKITMVACGTVVTVQEPEKDS